MEPEDTTLADLFDDVEDEDDDDWGERKRPEYIPTGHETEHALLISVETPNQTWNAAESIEELARLAESVDVEVVGSLSQKLTHPHPATYVGKGKLEEVKAMRDEVN